MSSSTIRSRLDCVVEDVVKAAYFQCEAGVSVDEACALILNGTLAPPRAAVSPIAINTGTAPPAPAGKKQPAAKAPVSAKSLATKKQQSVSAKRYTFEEALKAIEDGTPYGVCYFGINRGANAGTICGAELQSVPEGSGDVLAEYRCAACKSRKGKNPLESESAKKPKKSSSTRRTAAGEKKSSSTRRTAAGEKKSSSTRRTAAGEEAQAPHAEQAAGAASSLPDVSGVPDLPVVADEEPAAAPATLVLGGHVLTEIAPGMFALPPQSDGVGIVVIDDNGVKTVIGGFTKDDDTTADPVDYLKPLMEDEDNVEEALELLAGHVEAYRFRDGDVVALVAHE